MTNTGNRTDPRFARDAESFTSARFAQAFAHDEAKAYAIARRFASSFAFADELDADGKPDAAAEVREETRDSIREALAPRPRVVIRCDNCGGRVSDTAAAHFDALGVDWAHCAACSKASARGELR